MLKLIFSIQPNLISLLTNWVDSQFKRVAFHQCISNWTSTFKVQAQINGI